MAFSSISTPDLEIFIFENITTLFAKTYHIVYSRVVVVVVVLGFYVPPTAKVIRKRDLRTMVSSGRLEKPGIELTTPGLLDE